MPTPFQFPYLVTRDTPAVAEEVQGNLDALLTWVTENYVQKDDTPGFDANIQAPFVSGADTEVVQKAYVDTVVPTGMIVMWPSDVKPAGQEEMWEWCRGQTVSAADPKYTAVAAAIGTRFGGTISNPQLPNLIEKFPLGAAVLGDVGDTGGSTAVPQHNHTATFAGSALPNHRHTMPSHIHTMPTHVHSIGSHSHTVSGTVNISHDHGNTGSGGAHSHSYPNPVVANFGTGNLGLGEFVPGRPLNLTGGNTSSQAAHVHDVPPLGTTNKSLSGGATNNVNLGNTGPTDPGNTNPTDPGDTNNASAGTPSGSVTVANRGDANENRPPWVAVNYMIRL